MKHEARVRCLQNVVLSGDPGPSWREKCKPYPKQKVQETPPSYIFFFSSLYFFHVSSCSVLKLIH